MAPASGERYLIGSLERLEINSFTRTSISIDQKCRAHCPPPDARLLHKIGDIAIDRSVEWNVQRAQNRSPDFALRRDRPVFWLAFILPCATFPQFVSAETNRSGIGAGLSGSQQRGLRRNDGGYAP